MFDSKTDNLNWAYVSRQSLCDNFSTNLTIPGMNGCIVCLVSNWVFEWRGLDLGRLIIKAVKQMQTLHNVVTKYTVY